MKRVTELIICPDYRGPEYDESRFNGHAVEAVLKNHLVAHGFQDQVEMRYGSIVGHIDFFAERGDYVEIIETKNTATVKYTHILQLASYKALVHKIYNKPVIGHLAYIKFETVLGESPVRPAWVPDGWKYVHIDIDSGEHYINWLLFRTDYKSKIAGPYCISCQTDCKIKHIIRKGPSNKLLLEVEP